MIAHPCSRCRVRRCSSGCRLWASVCLALYVAFWLELDNAQWAGTSAAIVCQPHLGASLRKGWFRMIGTVVGAVAIVVLTACFPQDRAPFLVGLALWGAGCALVATLLHNFAAYSAALAGYAGRDHRERPAGRDRRPERRQAFMLAVFRASEICIGIVACGRCSRRQRISVRCPASGGRPVCRHRR